MPDVTIERLTSIPATITAGDSVAITLTLADYPASDGWSVSWALAGPSVLTVTSTADDDDHLLDATIAQTSALTAGLYEWTLRATLSTYSRVFSTGRITIDPDLASAGDGDFTSWEETTIVVLRAAIAGTIEGGMKMHMINGRQVMELSLEEQLKTLAMLESRQAQRSGNGFGSTIRYSYRNPARC